MFVRPKMGYVRAKIGLTGQFDRRQPGNYLQPWYRLGTWGREARDLRISSMGRVGWGCGDLKYRDAGDAGCE